MKLLLLAALKNRRHYFLLITTLFSIIFLTIASQMEVAAIGVIANKGSNAFELFAPVDQKSTDVIYKEDVLKVFDAIGQQEALSKNQAQRYLAKKGGANLFDRMLSFLDHRFSLSKDLSNLAYLLVVVAIFKAISLFMHRFTTRLVAIRVSRDLRQQYFEHIQKLPLNFYHKYPIGNLSTRVVGDAEVVAEGINALLINYLQTPFTLISTLVICLLTSWQLSLIIFCGFPLIYFPVVILARKVKKVAKQLQRNQENFASVLIDFLSGVETVKIFSIENYSLEKYTERNQNTAKLEEKGARYDLSMRPLVHTIGMFLLAFAILYGLHFLQMSVAEILFFSGLLIVFYEHIKKFAEENTKIQKGVAAAERMDEVMQLEPEITDAKDAIKLSGFQSSVEFCDVWFRYDQKWILQGLSFEVKKGSSIAIVGSTGAGKSTIVQLLPRLYDPQKGSIKIDGKTLLSYQRSSILDQMAFVSQSPSFFIDTIYNNLTFGLKVSDDKVDQALKKAHAKEFVDQLKNGVHTMLDEGASNLSGGQRQRLAIARALLKGGSILVMDEATSSLDNVSESYIKKAVEELKSEMTQIIIAHRLSTIDKVDRILFLQEGKKIAEGTKEELLKTCPPFARMWQENQS